MLKSVTRKDSLFDFFLLKLVTTKSHKKARLRDEYLAVQTLIEEKK